MKHLPFRVRRRPRCDIPAFIRFAWVMLPALGPMICLVACGGDGSADGPLDRGRPRIHFARTTVDLGALEPGSEPVARFPWRRAGRGPLRLAPVRAECGCAGTRGLDEWLPPRARGVLAVKLHVPDRSGPLVVRVRVTPEGDARDLPPVLVVRGFVERPWSFEPDHVRLGPIAPGSTLEASVRLRLHRGVEAPGGPEPALAADLVGLEGVVSAVRIPATYGPSGTPGGRALAMFAKAPDRPGRFLAWIRIRMGDADPIRLPVSGEVVTGSPDVSESRHERRRDISRRELPQDDPASEARGQAGGEAAPLPAMEPAQPDRGHAHPAGLRGGRRGVPAPAEQGRRRR